MKKLKELTLKEYTDLRRSGLMLIVFPDATGDFREDCEEMNMRPGTCKECKFYFDCRKGSIANAYGGFECAEKWKIESTQMNNIRKPKPAEPLIVKSGGTWVASWDGVDYLWATDLQLYNPLNSFKMCIQVNNTHDKWLSFTGSNPDITELTDEIAKLRPIVKVRDYINNSLIISKLIYVDEGNTREGAHKYHTSCDAWSTCRLATTKELQE